MSSRVMSLVAGLGLLANGAAHAQAAVGTTVPQVVTSATGEAAVAPDRAWITFAVETRSATAAAAASDNAKRQRAVIDALRGKGIAAERISTTGFSVQAEERYDKGQRTIVGYTARNGVQVDVQQIDQVGPLIDAALSAGSNFVGGLRFYSSRFEEVRRSALTQAVARARADAEAMAKAAGGTLGDPIEMMTNDSGSPRPVMYAEARMAMATDAAGPTPIESGEQRVTASVTIRWQLIPGRR